MLQVVGKYPTKASFDDRQETLEGKWDHGALYLALCYEVDLGHLKRWITISSDPEDYISLLGVYCDFSAS